MKKLFLDFVFWKSPGKTHFHSVDCSISVHSVLRTPCTEKEQSTPWKWFYLTFSRKLHKKLLFLRELREVAPEMELFPENHSPYEKYFVTKSNPYAKFSARHFTKKICILKNMSGKWLATFF